MWIGINDLKLLEGEMRSRHGSNCLRAHKNALLLEHQGRRAISQNPVSGLRGPHVRDALSERRRGISSSMRSLFTVRDPAER
jgi:hypothetical protein